MSRMQIDSKGATQKVVDAIIAALEGIEGVTLVLGDTDYSRIHGWIDDEDLVGSPIGFGIHVSSNSSVEEHLKKVMAEIQSRRDLRDDIASLPTESD